LCAWQRLLPSLTSALHTLQGLGAASGMGLQ
jgi:hypothetical protein